MNINLETLSFKLNKEYENLKAFIEKPNILLVGGTGTGKSSVVNLCFGKDIAEVGVGKPVTKCLERFEVPDIPIKIFDTKGYELGTEEHAHFLNDVVNYALQNKLEKEKQIHIVWYFIQASGHRILDIDEDIIKRFEEMDIPVAIVFTKCDLISEDEMLKMQTEGFRVLPKIPQFQITNKKSLNYLDLEKLCTWSINNLPKGLKFAFIAGQKINLNAKREEAQNIVIQHTGASAFVGFSPIPFSDAPILLANQAGMLVRVLFIYDMESLIPTIQGMIGSLGIPAIVSSSGIWITSQLLKIIPGVGTIAGGLISAGVASALTSAIGFSIIEFCDKTYSVVLEGNIEKLKHHIDSAETLFESIVIKKYKNIEDNR